MDLQPAPLKTGREHDAAGSLRGAPMSVLACLKHTEGLVIAHPRMARASAVHA